MQIDSLTGQKHRRPRWSTATRRTVGIIILIAFALIAYEARVVFVPLIIGAVMAYLLYPVAQSVARITRLPHGLATLLVFLVALGLLIPGGIVAAPMLKEQVTVLRSELADLVTHTEQAGAAPIVLIPGIEISPSGIVGQVGEAWRNLIRTALPDSLTILADASKTFLLFIFTFFMAYYMTADGPRIIAWFKRLVPEPYRPDAQALLDEINPIWAEFFRGQALLALVVTLIITAISLAIGLPQPLLMGLLAGVLEFLVSVGHTIWLVIALVLALTKGSTLLPVSNVVFALIVIGTNLVFTKFDLNVLIPAIVGSRVRLHPMVVLIGIIVGASIGGVLGIALAAPTIASLRVIGRYVYARLFDAEIGAEAAIEEKTEPVAKKARVKRVQEGEAA